MVVFTLLLLIFAFGISRIIYLVLDRRKRSDMVIALSLDCDENNSEQDKTQKSHKKQKLSGILVIGSIYLALYFLNARIDIKLVIAVILTGGSILFQRRLIGWKSPSKAIILRQIAYELPLIMERIVMAVQAGHDILPALKVVLDYQERNGKDSKIKRSRVLEILREVVVGSEAGMTLQTSLRIAAQKNESTPLRHALLHIAVAHEQGGGLLYALSELSDATQSYYQETVEEQIAALPIKATLPLVVVFGGLLVLLLTSPIIQVLETTISYGSMK